MQTPRLDQLEILEDVVIGVEGGLITDIVPASEHTGPIDDTLDHDSVLVPGFIDLHIHAPQWPQLGTGYDLPLHEWLFEHTFPLEAMFEDLDFAHSVWGSMVPTLLAHGTTTAVYYGSTHVDATTALAQACIDHGQRAWVGRVAMDHPEGTPDYYRDKSPSEGIAASRTSIEQIVALNDPLALVRPIITPRFIPACTDELLSGLGALAQETGHLVQTHCSENDWEHNHVLDRHEQSDTHSLDGFGLLRAGTVLAHGCMLSDDDFGIIADRGSGVAHCPLSNVYFGDAVFPTRRALAHNVNVGLGTDIAGGPSASLLAQAAHAVNSSRQLEHGVDQTSPAGDRGVAESRIDVIAAFYLATMGGAEVLGEPLGLIEVGRRFDAVAISMSGVDRWPGGDTAEQRFEKLVRTAGPKDISSVWVDGIVVHAV